MIILVSNDHRIPHNLNHKFVPVLGRHQCLFRGVFPSRALLWWLITPRWICMRATRRVIWILNTWNSTATLLHRRFHTISVLWKYKGAIRVTTKKQLSIAARQIDHYLYCAISWFTCSHMEVTISCSYIRERSEVVFSPVYDREDTVEKQTIDWYWKKEWSVYLCFLSDSDILKLYLK